MVTAPSDLAVTAHDATTIDLSWTDNATAEDGYRIYVSTDGGSSFTQNGSDLPADTESGTASGLVNGEEYTIEVRAFDTSAGEEAASGTVVQVTDLPAPSGFSAPQPDWFEALSVSASWTDNSNHGDEEWYIQASTDGGSNYSRATADLGADTTSTTLDDGDLNYDTTYELRAEIATEHVTAVSSSVTVVTPPVDINSQSGFWLALVSGDSSAADRRAETDTVLGRTINFAREHTAKSDFEVSVAYDETLESEVFSECHLLFGSDHLFAGEVDTVESDEEAGMTTISGDGAPAAQLERGEASVTYTSTNAWEALQDYLDNHANLSGTVTNPEGTALTVTDQDLQTADTSAEFNNILAAGSPAATDPWEENGSGSIVPLQTLFFSEGEAYDNNSGTSTIDRPDFSGDGVDDGDGQGEQLTSSGEFVEFEFTTSHTIPEADIGLQSRQEQTGNDPPGMEISLNGTTLWSRAQGVSNLSLAWRDVNENGFGSDLSPGTHTVRCEVTATGTDDWNIDAIALYDKGGSRFTANYNFDETLSDGTDGGRYLDGPELFPESVRAAFAQASTAYRITAVSISTTFNDTTGAQAIGWSVDGGSTWNDTANTSSITDVAVSTPSTTITGSVLIGRTTETRNNTTPLTGFNNHELQTWDLDIDGDTVGVLEDETVNGDHLENIQRLAKRAGVRFYLTHDPDEANWTVEAFAEGDRYQTADWDTLNRTRTVSVEGYANRIVGYGALQGDGTRLRVALDDTSEQSAFGQTIERTFTDPSITSTAALRSEVRTRLSNAVDEDSLVGIIDVVPIALTPGVSYQVEAWNGVYDGRYGHETYGGSSGGEPPTLAAERITYRQGRTDGLGRLHFETPGGLGDAVSSVERRAREIGDAV